MSYQPTAIYNISKTINSRSTSLIWCEVLKNRYAIEVQHTGTCKGNLIIFDAHSHFRVIHEEPVTIHYDGKQVDQVDIDLWLQKANAYII